MSFVRLSAFVLFAAASILSALSAQGFSPEAALAKMESHKGFSVRLVASEPLVRQPLSISFDPRGRLWVLQALQFPDAHKTSKGADRLTILSNPDENGKFRQANDFVGGLNRATGFCLGSGGVFVLQAPDLLFYPDRDGDDVPDGDPEVLLSGFGSDDVWSLAGSLRFGPDGWLYGTQGGGTTAKIRGIEFRQGIWRYHPRTRVFELFSQGGGNSVGIEFDRFGQLLAGTDVGGHATLHVQQGAHYADAFRWPRPSPFAYGHFESVPCSGFRGGRISCGGVILADQYISADPLSNAVRRYRLDAKGASYTSAAVGELLVGHDAWFRPIDCRLGPEGAIYVADWYDRRFAPLDAIENWDKTNGRIYRIDPTGTAPAKVGRPEMKTSLELADLLAHPNAFWRGEARRCLAERRDPKIVPILRERLAKATGALALENLWGVYASGGFDRATALGLLDHPESWVRAWTVRLLGDERSTDPAIEAKFLTMAKNEAVVAVRAQLACSLRRFTADHGLPAIFAMLECDRDADDPHLPLLVWWAVETRLGPQTAIPASARTSRLWRTMVAERLARKWVTLGTISTQTAVADLLRTSDAPERAALIRGIDLALDGRHRPENVPDSFRQQVAEGWKREPQSQLWHKNALRMGVAEAIERVRKPLSDLQTAEADLLRAIALAAEIPEADVSLALRNRLDSPSEVVREAAYGVLVERLADAGVRESLLRLLPKLPPAGRRDRIGLLLADPDAALAVLKLIESKVIPRDEVSPERVASLSLHRRPAIDALVAKLYGRPSAATSGEKQARIAWLGTVLLRGPGDATKGREVFGKLCASCHRLHGIGDAVGPDLAGVERKNRGYLLSNIVDPSGHIRPEFQTWKIEASGGRRFSGIIAPTDGEILTLVRGNAGTIERVSLRLADIKVAQVSSHSPMPEKLLDGLREDEARDLFAFLESDPDGVSRKPPKRKL